MNVTRSGTETMTSFQATLVNAGYGQLVLKDPNGKIAQKWTLGQPKSVVGAHANCSVRCMLPGIADHHLLLVVGARQIYLRALAAGVQRDGVAVNELVMTGDRTQFAFTLAGHRFEYSRQSNTVPTTKPFIGEDASIAKPERVDALESPKRLRFTFVQALEKNRERSEPSSSSETAGELSSSASEKPVWVEEIVRDALRPVELRLATITEPIHNLERQLRRQRAQLRKQRRARKLSQHTAHEVGQIHAENLIQSQETIHKIVASQAARLELVNERVADIVSQLASLERIVSAETNQQREIANRTSQSGEEIIRLQREMLALVAALQTRIAQPPADSGEETLWRAAIERQLAELHQSLGILDEIKSSLDIAIDQSRELSHDLEAQRQVIQEVAKRPVIVQSIAAYAPENPDLQKAAAVSPHSEIVQPQHDQSRSQQEPAALALADDLSVAHTPDHSSIVADASAMLGATAMESSPSPGDVRLVPTASSAAPAPLPSWWAEDPVLQEPSTQSGNAPTGTIVFSDDVPLPGAQYESALANDVSADDDAPSEHASYSASSGWQATEFEQETGPGGSEMPWSYAPEPLEQSQSGYPVLDISQSLSSLAADPTASLAEPTQSFGTQSYGAPNFSAPSAQSQTFVEQTFDEPTFAEQTFDEPSLAERIDIRDASDAVNQSASVIENQLQQWLSDDYASNHAPLMQTEHDDLAAADGDRALPMSEISGAAEEEFVQSAFSDERLSIEEARSDSALQYEQNESDVAAPYEPAYRSADRSEDQYSSATSQRNDDAHSSDGGDESVEEYMRRLLARMRGVSESEVKLPGLDKVESPQPETRSRSFQAETTSTVVNSSSDTEPASETWTAPFDPTHYVPRVTAPEKNRDIDALRELANTSARSAIQVSARRKHGTAIMIKTAVALVGLTAGGALVSINGLRVNIGLIATIASFLVATIWGYDALATLRPLLQASHAATPRASQPEVEESEAEPS